MEESLEYIRNKGIDLVVVDEMLPEIDTFKFMHELVGLSPLTHGVVVSSLSSEQFHTETEGLGVLMQRPPQPDVANAKAHR